MKTMSVLAIALMAVLAYGTAEATVFVVDPTPPACVNPSGAVFFPTIGAAVAAAAAGDRIYVCPGTYPENVTVAPTQSNLTLLGIDRPRVVPGNPGLPGFQILASRVRIQGFEVAGFLDVFACGIVVGDRFAPLPTPPSGVIVINNVAHENFGGICFFNAGENEARDNTVEHNSLFGIADLSTVGPIGSNLVIGNRVRGNLQGISLGDGVTTRVDMNEVTGNFVGIGIANAGGVISRNTVTKSQSSGIEALHSVNFKLDHNTVRENVGVGILVEQSLICSVDENSVARNAEGIRLDAISSCQAYRNVVQQNATIGINALNLGPGDVFIFNTASGNRVLDCNWDGSDAPTFADNRCATENPPGAWD
jgi:parallel beta-helix repeat protein